MYAYVKEGIVLRTFNDLPDAWENVSNFHFADRALRESYGIYDAKDQRPELGDGQHYEDESFTFTGTDVIWTAVATNPPPPTQDVLDRVAVRNHTKLQALKEMTPAEVEIWVETNVTNLATAKDAIKTLAVAVSVLSRKI